jgi:hypothetical protein
MKYVSEQEPIEYRSKMTIRQEEKEMAHKLKLLNDDIIRKAQRGESVETLISAERIACGQYLHFTLKYAPSLKYRLCS